MIRKDCEYSRKPAPPRGAAETLRVSMAAVVTIGVIGGTAVEARAGSIRIWPTAVVVSDSIRLDDLCELRGFGGDVERKLAGVVVSDAPSPGGSRVIHLTMIRSALAAQGVNQADVTVGGAVRCEVTRPSEVDPGPRTATQDSTLSRPHPRAAHRQAGAKSSAVHSTFAGGRMVAQATQSRMTLRQAVIEHFNDEHARYHGSAEVVFDRTSDQVLALADPRYTFRVRRRSGRTLGLVPVEVDVIAQGQVVQSVSLVVRVTLLRPTVVARRAINQSATIHATDVEVISMRYTVVDELGMDDPTRVVGQRAKRMIRAGSVIEAGMLEVVPLVVRGQLVSLVAAVGGVRVVTTAKATEDGLLGETVKVRAADNKRIEFDAVVVGPGKVVVGGDVPAWTRTALAAGAGR